jgi:3-hydroxybutyryl-CoA dehydrogenase
MTNMANASSIMNLAVLGSGQMGSGIAQVAAQSGKKVFLYDNKSEALQKSKNGILKSLEKLESKKLITEKATDVLARITFTDKIQDLKTAQVVIEAVTENFEVKTSLFKQLDGLLASDAILASNTSSIPITRLAAVTKRAERIRLLKRV